MGTLLAPMKKKRATESPFQEASPYKSAVEALDALRATLRGVCQEYLRKLDAEVAQIRDQVAAAGPAGEAPRHSKSKDGRDAAERIYDLRDLLTLLRTAEIKPKAGRRKDLKKIEGLIEEARELVRRWD